MSDSAWGCKRTGPRADEVPPMHPGAGNAPSGELRARGEARTASVNRCGELGSHALRWWPCLSLKTVPVSV